MIDNFRESNIEESEKFINETQRAKTEVLSGFEVAKIAEEIYHILGPKIGCRLVEANVVLTMAGLKGFADIHDVKLDKHEIEKIKELNRIIEKSEIKLDCPMEISDFSKSVQLSLYNNRFRKNVQILDSDSQDAWVGKLLGYPMQAISDFEEFSSKELVESDIVSSIPEAQKYDGAIPDFDYHPKHKNKPEIVNYIKKSEEILRDFYKSDWHQKLIHDVDFLADRQRLEELKKR